MSPAFLTPLTLPTSTARSAPSLCAHRPNALPTRPVRARRAVVATAAEPVVEAGTAWKTAKELSLLPASDWETVQDARHILTVLPHRYPFLLVDRVIAFEPGVRAVCVKTVSFNEPQFTGHFPNNPIMPGVMQVEALAQVGGIVMLQQPISDGKGDFFFGGVDKVKWRKPVTPGDTLVMEMTLDTFKERFGIAKMTGRAYVAGDLVCEGQFTLVKVVEK